MPKDGASPAGPTNHVRHGSKPDTATAYVSASEDPSVALLSALPFGRVAAISPSLAEVEGGGSARVPHAVVEGGLPPSDDASRQFAVRSAETLFRGAVPKGATEVLRTRLDALPVIDVPDGHAGGRAFPATLAELAALAVTTAPMPLGASGGADRSVGALSRRGPHGAPDFVFLRMSRNALPPAAAPIPDGGADGPGASDGAPVSAADFVARVEPMIAHGRAQVAAAVAAFRTAHPAGPAVAYFEADVAVLQERVVCAALPRWCVLPRVPFVLLRVPPAGLPPTGAATRGGGDGDARALDELRSALDELHWLKKGAAR